MISLRGWLTAPDGAALNEAIERMRRTGVEPAPWSHPTKAQAYVSGFDGSRLQSIFLVLKEEGRKHAIAALIGLLGMGVRDAWVGHGASKREVDGLVRSGDQFGGMTPVDLEYVAAAVRQFLAGNAQSGLLPPFGVLAFAECARVSHLDPETTSLDDCLSRSRRQPPAVWTGGTSPSWLATYSPTACSPTLACCDASLSRRWRRVRIVAGEQSHSARGSCRCEEKRSNASSATTLVPV